MPIPRDSLYGRLAVELGRITQEQLEEALKNQRAMREGMGIDQALGPILLGKGLITPDQAEDLSHAVEVESGEARLIAGYEIVSKLGQGAMGTVYKAKKLDTGEFVALKILPPSLADEKTIARFARESEIVRELDHDNIVACVDFGRDEKRSLHYCALELVEGKDLYATLQRDGALAEDEAVAIVVQVGMALQHAHFNGLVHRDVKPENIMVTPDGTAKLLDLGLARPAGEGLSHVTQAGYFVGSPYYASVEQARGSQDIDIRSDIYSLGATLYHVVTGKPPFEGSTAIEVLGQHIKEKLPWPADVKPELSEGLCRIIAKMMAKDPAKRYQTPNELLDALDLLEEGETPDVEKDVLSASTIQKARKPKTAHKHGAKTTHEHGGKKRARAHAAAKRTRTAAGREVKKPKGKRAGPSADKERAGDEETGEDGAASGGDAPAGTAGFRRVMELAASRPTVSIVVGATVVVVAGIVVSAIVASRRGRARRPAGPAAAVDLDKFLSDTDRALGRNYRLLPKPLKWFDAFSFCLSAGGHLVTVESPEENAFVSALSAEAGGPVWLGLTDEQKAGEWRWITGERATFAAWGEGSPRGDALKRWAALDVGNGEWKDRAGEDQLPFVCEWERVARGPGLLAQYFRAGSFEHLITQRVDKRVELWLDRRGGLWVRWTGELAVPRDGSYVFRAVGGGAVRLFVGGGTVIDRWPDAASEEAGTVDLKAGPAALRMEWAKGPGPGGITLSWGGEGMPMNVVPTEALSTPNAGPAAPPAEAGAGTPETSPVPAIPE